MVSSKLTLLCTGPRGKMDIPHDERSEPSTNIVRKELSHAGFFKHGNLFRGGLTTAWQAHTTRGSSWGCTAHRLVDCWTEGLGSGVS